MVEDPFARYLAAQPEPHRSTLIKVAASLRKILPGAQECISYGMPAFQVDGTSIAGFAGFKQHCSYFPHSGSTLERLPAEDLDGYVVDKGTLRFPIDAPLPVPLLRRLVAARLQIESEKRPATGKVREFYDNGVLQSKGSLRKGEPHGAWTWYRKDGSVMRTGQYRSGVEAGTWHTFDPTGAVVKESHF